MKYRKSIITGLVFVLLAAAMITANMACAAAQYRKGEQAMNKIQTSPQYKAGKFQNSHPWQEPSFTEYFSSGWEFLTGGEQRTPKDSVTIQPADLTHFMTDVPEQLNVTWAGHSTLLIHIDGYRIITDPVFEKSVSFFGPTRYNGDLPLDPQQLPEIDVVLISHNHYDHLNKYSIQLLKERTKKFIVPLAVGAQLRQWGVPQEKIVELDWWDKLNISDDLQIVATPAQHFSGRSLTDRNATLWASYVVTGTKHKIYFSGDSGYFDGFKQIGEKYGPFDMTFLETGAYNEQWHHIHMFPEETVQANLDLGGKILHPIHWGTFNLAMHSWFDPMRRLTARAAELGVKVATPIAGGTTIFDTQIPDTPWWPESHIAKKDNGSRTNTENHRNEEEIVLQMENGSGSQ